MEMLGLEDSFVMRKHVISGIFDLLIIVLMLMISSMTWCGIDIYLSKYVSIEDETEANGIEIEENPKLCP